MLIGTNLTYTKEYNLRIVHETIRLHGPLSRSDIARRTELSAQTVSNLVRTLMKFGLIMEADKRQEGRGAPSITLAVNPEGAYSVGLDFNRDHLTGVLVDLSGAVRQRIHHELHFPSPDEALDLMVETVEELARTAGISQDSLWGVGVGIPGPMRLDDDGSGSYLINPKAFPGWHDVPLEDWLEERLQLPVLLENNATAAAIGERWYGTGQHISTFFYLYFDSGLGGGLIVQGQPYEGQTGNAGEIGYLPVVADVMNLPPGVPPHVGEHFNLPRLYALLQEAGADVSRPNDLGSLFDDGFPPLLEWMDAAVNHLIHLTLAIEYLLDLDRIFFGGRLPHNILETLMQRVVEQLPNCRVDNDTTVTTYRLGTAGVDAAALGVATLPIYEFFAPTHRLLLKRTDDSSPVAMNDHRVISS